MHYHASFSVTYIEYFKNLYLKKINHSLYIRLKLQNFVYFTVFINTVIYMYILIDKLFMYMKIQK